MFPVYGRALVHLRTMRQRLGSKPDFARVGLLIPMVVGAALVARLIHASGPLHAATYTWWKPLEIFGGILESPDVPTWLALAYLLGWTARPGTLTNLRARLTRRIDLASHRAEVVASVASAVALLALDVLLFEQHGLLDHVAVLFAGGVVGARARGMVRDGAVLRAIGELAVAAAVLVLVSYAYTVVKAHVFVLTSPRDAVLVAPEELIFGGPAHRVVARWAAERPEFVVLCDRTYYRIFEHMAVVALFLSGLGRHRTRHTYVASLSVAYLVGAVAYFVVPSVGPAYSDPDTFAFLRALPLTTNAFQPFLLSNTMAAEDGSLARISTYEFIAAMPSLHMAHEFVMLHYSRFSRPFLVGATLFTTVTALAVVVLGWHYPADIVGGLLLAVFAVWVGGRGGAKWMPAVLRPASDERDE